MATGRADSLLLVSERNLGWIGDQIGKVEINSQSLESRLFLLLRVHCRGTLAKYGIRQVCGYQRRRVRTAIGKGDVWICVDGGERFGEHTPAAKEWELVREWGNHKVGRTVEGRGVSTGNCGMTSGERVFYRPRRSGNVNRRRLVWRLHGKNVF